MDSWEEMDKIAFEMTCLEIMYFGLSEEKRAPITFLQYIAFRKPSWSKEDILHGIIIADKKKKEADRWMEEQRNPMPSRSTQPCYSCKGSWEPDHKCRDQDQKHTIEARYDSDDEMSEDGVIDDDLGHSDDDSDSFTEASDSDSCIEDDVTSMLEEDYDPCTVDRQSGGPDDSTSTSAGISHGFDDLMPHQSGDTSEDSHVLAPTDDQPPMVVMTHMSSFQTSMIATPQEDISGMSDMIEEPCVRDAHHRHVDPLIQKETRDMQVVDPTLIDQHEEIESHLLETPLVEQIVEIDRFMEHLLPGSACMDEDALFSIQDDHSMCLDTAIWDPGADDSSRLSAQEDTTAHTGYSMIQRELAVEDDVQLRMGRPSGTIDSRQFNTLSSTESVVEYFSDGTSSERHEGVPQHDYDQESHHLAGQLRVSEAMIMIAT
jgi:hypothetical protein